MTFYYGEAYVVPTTAFGNPLESGYEALRPKSFLYNAVWEAYVIASSERKFPIGEIASCYLTTTFDYMTSQTSTGEEIVIGPLPTKLVDQWPQYKSTVCTAA